MKCRKCGGAAALELRRHNAAFCSPHFIEFFRKQVAEAIHHYRMLSRDEEVLVAVSGGKDSLALWDVLLEDGYRTAGLYLDLGIFEYSEESRAKCEAFAAARGQKLYVERVAEAVGAPIPEVQKVTRRPTCSACGLSKRYLMNRAALEHGFPVVATGHNLDDEAATLFCVGPPLADGRAAAPVAGAGAPPIPSSCGGSSRSTGCPSWRPRPTRSCAASTTSSRSAPSPRGPRRSPTRRS